MPNTLLMFASATLLNRSKKFIWRAVVGLARVVAGRRAVLGAKADAVVRRSAARIGAGAMAAGRARCVCLAVRGPKASAGVRVARPLMSLSFC